MRINSRFCAALAVTIFSSFAYADSFDVGYVSFDVTNPPLAEVDIVNATGPNNTAPNDFVITTPVNLSDLTLTVDFATGAPEVFDSSSNYFTLQSDGLSFNGNDIFNTTTDPVTGLTLTGSFSPGTFMANGITYNVTSSTFSVSIAPDSGNTALVDGDAAAISITGSTGTAVTPEPASVMLTALAFLGLLMLVTYKRRLLTRKSLVRIGSVLGLSCVTLLGSTTTTIRLQPLTSPSSGVSGSSQVWITGTGFPSNSFKSVTVSLATTCDATGTSATVIQEKPVLGSTDKIEFQVPASLASGVYYVSTSGVTTGGAFTSGTSCSKIQVTHTSTVLSSCNPGSSMGILAYNPAGTGTTPVTAYVPNGNWGSSGTGVQVVPLEGGGSAASVPTANAINSCSSNSASGETVCIDNQTGIYLINGSTLTTTLNSSSTQSTGFSGGDCENCTVAVNEAAGTKGQAVIGLGYSSAAGGTALQFLDLASNSLGTPVPMSTQVSEDILWDPFRNVILSPGEDGYYNLYQVTGSGIPGPSTVTELTNYLGFGFDSAAEDCTTQIALASIEGGASNGLYGLYITDLSQKTVTGSSWTAPGQSQGFPEFSEFSAATDGIAVAPGSTHLGVISGEFGGNQFAAISLPAKSGSGVPAVVDYVAAELPATPDGCGFSAGYDPHTTTAYTSPNNGKAYGVLADWQTATPDYVAVVDLAALLKAPRKTGIYPDGSPCAACVNVVDPSYDLVANHVVTYVPTGNPNCAGTSDARIHRVTDSH